MHKTNDIDVSIEISLMTSFVISTSDNVSIRITQSKHLVITWYIWPSERSCIFVLVVSIFDIGIFAFFCFHSTSTQWRSTALGLICLFGCFMVFNATLNNISVISWRSVFIGGGNWRTRRKLPTCRKSLKHFIT